MKKAMLFGLAAVVALASGAMASNSAQQQLSFQINEINEISLGVAPGTFVIETFEGAGGQPVSISQGTTYSLSTNGTNKRVTAALDENMPANTTLEVLFEAPTGAAAEVKALSATAVDVVTGITNESITDGDIAYNFSATLEAGNFGSATRTVTYTILDPVAPPEG